MAKYVIEDTTLTGIADAIRGKTGGTDPIPVTDMATQIAAITGGGSAETLTTILAEQTVVFTHNATIGAYTSDSNPSLFLPVVGETYSVIWDETEYICTAKEADTGAIRLGNMVAFGGEDTGEPFVMGSLADGRGMTIYCYSGELHTLAVYQKTSGGGSVEGIVYVTFMNGGTELCKTACMKGDSTVDPVQDGKIAVPTKDPSVSTVYTFSGGWALTEGGGADVTALVDVSEDRTVYAVYNESVRYYTVRFFDGESLLESLQVPYGQVPSPAEPTKDGFFFDDWSPELVAVTGDADYYAVWSESNILDSGTCGATAYWELTKDGVLTISGTGAMNDYDYSNYTPWYGYKDSIVSVIVLEGITCCGARMCAEHTNLVSVTLPEGLSTVGIAAFQSTGLTSVTLPETLTKADMRAFDTAGITAVYIPKNLTHIGACAFGAYSSALGGQSLSSVTFEVTEGWRVSNQGFTQAASGASVSAASLADPASAATLMTSTYRYYYWVRA